MIFLRLLKALFFLAIILISAVVSIPIILFKVGWILSDVVVNDIFSEPKDEDENNDDENGDNNNNIGVGGKGATT